LNLRKKLQRRRRSKLGISAVLGAVLMIGVTLAVAFTAWAWARSAAQNSELTFGNAVGSNINYMKENFEIIYVNYSSASPSQSATVWIYNTGSSPVFIKQILIFNSTYTFPAFTSLNSTQTTQFSCYCLELHSQTVGSISLSVSPHQFRTGVVYQFQALGVYGNTNTYQQTK
jgi:archaellum component FlaF (FlaF/FlaG flagellin family)